MRTYRSTIVATLIGLLVCSAAAGEPATSAAPVMPKPESVLKHIPAGSMGYVLINDVSALSQGVNRFLTEIGLGEMVAQSMPGGLLGMVRGFAAPGQGFNPNGGLAVVMLDVQKFGIDPSQMSAPQTDSDGNVIPPPVVILVAGSDVENVFYPAGAASDSKYKQVMLPMMGMLSVVKVGGYVAASPSTQALDMLVAASNKACDELTGQHAAVMARSDVAVHVNIKLVAPIINQAFDVFEQRFVAMQQMATSQGTEPYKTVTVTTRTPSPLALYRDLISQVDGVTISGRFTPKGLVIEKAVSLTPGSLFARSMAQYQQLGSTPLAGLPPPTLCRHLPSRGILPPILQAGNLRA